MLHDLTEKRSDPNFNILERTLAENLHEREQTGFQFKATLSYLVQNKQQKAEVERIRAKRAKKHGELLESEPIERCPVSELEQILERMDN